MIKTPPAGRRRTSAVPLPGSPVREKILLAAIEAIEKEGLPAVTIRSIARRAGVNSAAINYYFRSKDSLLREVSRTTVEHSLGDLKAILDSATDDPRAPLEDFLSYLMEGAVLYPGITKSNMYDVLVGRKADNPFLRRLNVLLARLAERLEKRKRRESRIEIRTKIVQMMSAAMLPALMPEAFRPLTGKSFHDPKARRAYIKSVIETCFKGRG
jgi:AcrR family transcriptional regulator